MSAGESRTAMTRIGVLGFGEAGSTFAKALADAGAVHGVAHERRYHEMNQVIDLLRDMQFDPIMAEATNRFFKRSTDLQLSRDFAGKLELMDDVIETLLYYMSQGYS